MSWLSTLPHQIPFRAASAVRSVGESTIEGVYLCTANDLLPTGVMVVEAMAQFAGGLAFRDRPGHGFFSGIDRCELLRQIEPGDEVVLTITMEAAFGGTYRFSGTGRIDGVEVVRARFYLASPPDAET